MTAPIDYAVFADLYDAIVQFDEDIAFFTEAAARAAGNVLELMSGTGRVSIPLLEAGAPLTCVDASREMLARLHAKRAARGGPDRMVLADVRSLPFCGAFDLAILAFHSFAELITDADRTAALSSVHRALVRGGRFICTLHNPAVRLEAIDGRLRTVGRCPRPSGRGELVLRTRLAFDPATRLAGGTQLIDELDDQGRAIGRRSMSIRFALLDRAAFEALAEAAGFRVLALSGDYRDSPYRENESPYMIWTLERE
jgi:SAM-dependent methyltransferase